MVQSSTIATVSVATAVTGLLAYAVYFDHQRRKSPDFRRSLRREERRQVRQEKEEAVVSRQAKNRDIHKAVDEVLEEGFPTDVTEKEQLFMEYVQQGEIMSRDPALTTQSALAFFKALKIYPQPSDLISIYDKTVEKRVLDVLGEMMAYDPTLDLPSSGINLDDMPAHPGPD